MSDFLHCLPKSVNSLSGCQNCVLECIVSVSRGLDSLFGCFIILSECLDSLISCLDSLSSNLDCVYGFRNYWSNCFVYTLYLVVCFFRKSVWLYGQSIGCLVILSRELCKMST